MNVPLLIFVIGVLVRKGNSYFISKNIFIKDREDRVFKIPIAHGEGRYYADEKTLDELEKNGQVIFRYCNEEGEVIPEANPNGSIRNIAGISNKTGNVFGMMPHPERACSRLLGNTDGRKVFNLLFSSVLEVV